MRFSSVLFHQTLQVFHGDEGVECDGLTACDKTVILSLSNFFERIVYRAMKQSKSIFIFIKDKKKEKIKNVPRTRNDFVSKWDLMDISTSLFGPSGLSENK